MIFFLIFTGMILDFSAKSWSFLDFLARNNCQDLGKKFEIIQDLGKKTQMPSTGLCQSGDKICRNAYDVFLPIKIQLCILN